MICGMTYYQICWYFLLYSFLGWCVEVAFHAVTLGKVINRGFLNGPLCPVYGFGMLAVLACSNLAESSGILKVRSDSGSAASLLALYAGGVILATLVELIAGWMLDVLFHTRWWDYSKKPFNFRGYICLEFSLLWGLGITLIIRILHPMFEASSKGFESRLPVRYGWYVLLVLYALTLADLILTIMTIIGLNKKLKELDEISSKLRTVSDSMTEVIAVSTIKTTQAVQEGQVQAALAKAELRDAVQDKSELLREETNARRSAATENAAIRKAAFTDSVETSLETGKEVFTKAASDAEKRIANSKNELALKKEQLEKQLAAIKKSATSRSLTSGKRLMQAFPDLQSRDYREQLEELKRLLKSGNE